ncbi:SUMO1/Ulp2 [Trypanosoma grayi]|uniref:SUMO1/Ulp2 n=1 Tax=Trypanosoma grayi TaxID=71804 RepID=UPI0004F4146E|nr:SUMO1/Ulp2 [Trypanosoma grayi]KEG07623.1 SUMO1/Ulp2 [Trypanosoma grayi]
MDSCSPWDVTLYKSQSPQDGQAYRGGVNLLQLADALGERCVRDAYEDIMTSVCGEVVEREVMAYHQRVEGAAVRALDRWMLEVLLEEIASAKRDVSPEMPLSKGIHRHIEQNRAAVLTKLTADAEDEQLYGRAMRYGGNSSSSTRDGGDHLNDAAVTFKNGLLLTYQQLATLGPGQWLNDQVINAYLSMVCDEYNTRVGADATLSLGTHFFAKVLQELRGGTSKLPPLQASSGVLRWLKRRRHILLPGTTRIVLVPVNLSQTHWALAVLDWENRRWVYYDSYIHGEAATSRGRAVLRQLAHAFTEARRLLCGGSGGENNSNKKDDDACEGDDDWGLVVAQPQLCGRDSSDADGFSVAPQQENFYDCGAFVCHAAWCAVHGVAMAFTQIDVTALRHVMVHELLCQKNLLRLPDSVFSTP